MALQGPLQSEYTSTTVRPCGERIGFRGGHLQHEPLIKRVREMGRAETFPDRGFQDWNFLRRFVVLHVAPFAPSAICVTPDGKAQSRFSSGEAWNAENVEKTPF